MAVMTLVLDLGIPPDKMDQIVDQPTPFSALYLPDEAALVGMTNQIDEVLGIIRQRMMMNTTPKTYDLDLIREIVKLVLTFQSYEGRL